MKKTKRTPEEENAYPLDTESTYGNRYLLENLHSAFGTQFSENKLVVSLPPAEAGLSVSEFSDGSDIVRPSLYIAPKASSETPAIVLAVLPQENVPDTVTLSAKSGVKELWLLEPLQKRVSIYGVKNKQFVKLASFAEGETFRSALYPQLVVNTDALFAGMEENTALHEPVMEYGQLDLNGTYTYWNYLRWQFKERVELIRGKIFKMSPAPNLYHQRISRNLSMKFVSLFEGNACEVFFAPFDVRLPVANAQKDTTVVQPDLCVVCDKAKLNIGGCNGAPDLVVEILSPGNSRHEMDTKFNVYEQSGVKEYWIVDFERRLVLLYTLNENVYTGLHPFTEGHVIQSPLFPTLQINVDEIFDRVE